jgi:serine/threonine protein phosphatase PrpC
MNFSISIPNSEYGHLVPPEDSLYFSDSLFVVADGITRDSGGDSDTAGKTFIDLAPQYPNPSGARFAADTFCESIARTLLDGPHSLDRLKEAFILANTDIAILNADHNVHVDFLRNDYYGCVASVALVEGNTVLWGYIGDCGIALFSSSGELKYKTTDGLTNFQRYIATVPGIKTDPARRRFIRSEVRNNPGLIFNDAPAGYGALTGQTEAEAFMEFGTAEFDLGDLLVVYSDGFIDTVSHPDFFSMLHKPTTSLVSQAFIPYTLNLARQDAKRYGSERSLIAYTINE